MDKFPSLFENVSGLFYTEGSYPSAQLGEFTLSPASVAVYSASVIGIIWVSCASGCVGECMVAGLWGS